MLTRMTTKYVMKKHYHVIFLLYSIRFIRNQCYKVSCSSSCFVLAVNTEEMKAIKSFWIGENMPWKTVDFLNGSLILDIEMNYLQEFYVVFTCYEKYQIRHGNSCLGNTKHQVICICLRISWIFYTLSLCSQNEYGAFDLYCGMLPYATDNKYPAYDLPVQNTVRKRL
ncbi:hypothetical protein ANN_27120 [Periplaneta americana]|uniref:Uncharacterized protein n=1 Tax=Periplaneta americana TaxID=6978 RepID=A0ABQ8RX63_PERAM|nr:hypothetical protein ANN_27120 [Periplaneta americana]